MTPPTDAPIRVAEAARRIDECVAALPAERVPLALAHGRVLRETVVAERDQPPFDRATMDGIALASGERATELRVTAEGAAGRPVAAYAGAGTCVEIMTGAPVPAGADCVVPVEDIERDGDRVCVRARATRAPWRYVHRRGSDHGAGTVLLEPCTLLRGPELAVVASAGLAEVVVTRRARVSLVVTGDELVDVGAPLADHQIRRTNDYAGAALIEGRGLARVERVHAGDDADALAQVLGDALAASDALIVSGGVSMGRYDFVAGTLAALGVRKVFHRVAQRPGKPLWFGVAADGRPVFALPGNPVSSMVCLRRYVVPALEKMAGSGEPKRQFAVLEEMAEFTPPLTWFVPALVRDDAEGRRVARLRVTNTSGDFTALAGTDGLVELARDGNRFEAGTAVPWYPW